LARLNAHPDLQAAYRRRASDERSLGRVRKKGRRDPEPFEREKLRKSLLGTVHRRIDEAALESLVTAIEARVAAADPEPVSTATIREWVTEELRRIDSFAYLRILTTTPGVDLPDLRKELIAIQSGLVRKDKGRFEAFSRSKLIDSIGKATAKRTTISTKEIEGFAEGVRERVREEGDPVDSKRIGSWVLDWLREKDPVSYLSFLMVFDPPDSPRELQRMLEDSDPGRQD